MTAVKEFLFQEMLFVADNLKRYLDQPDKYGKGTDERIIF